MVNLTFAEQVRIVLGRKSMTIKQLAEVIEEKTGTKMSRQNLTQRLNRDNFQEQDMRMITEILGCNFELNILGEKVQEVSEVEVTPVVEEKPLVEEKPVVEVTPVVEATPVTEEKLVVEAEPVAEEKPIVEATPVAEEKPLVEEKPEAKVYREATIGEFTKASETVAENTGDLKKGEINPYTGFEYKTNSVRTHKNKIGYVQVYDRKSHSWTEMTEWAFLGYQERQKVLLGKSYEEPTYLD